MAKPIKKSIGGLLGILAEKDLRGAIPGVIPSAMLNRRRKRQEGGTAATRPTGMKKGGKVAPKKKK
jgi:hypothetical protein